MCDSYVDVLVNRLRYMDATDRFPAPIKGYKLVFHHGTYGNFRLVSDLDPFSAARAGKGEVGFSVMQLPGLYIIHSAYVDKSLRGQGLGKWLALQRIEAWKTFKAEQSCDNAQLICRVNSDNEKQKSILRSVGWQQITETLWEVVEKNWEYR